MTKTAGWHLKGRFEALPIGRKFALFSLLILVATTGTMATLLFWADVSLFRHNYAKQLIAEAAVVAYGTKAALIFGSIPDAEETLSVLGSHQHIQAAVLYDSAGKSFAIFQRKPQELPERIQEKSPSIWFHWYRGYVEIVIPVRDGDETAGWLFIRAALTPIFEQLKWNVLIITAASLIALILGIFLVWWFKNMVSSPLVELTSSVQRHGREMGLTITAEKAMGDEIAILRSSFQELLDNLRRRDEDLTNYHRELEGLVTERTQALAEANRQLQEELVQRRRVEEEQRWLIAAIQQSAEGIFITNERWRILFTNRAFATMLGYEPPELVGRHTGDLKSVVHDKDFYRDIRETVNAGQVWRGRAVNRKKDGTLIDMDVTVSPVFDEMGRIASFVFVHRDISDQVRAEKEQEALQERLRQAEKMEALGSLAGGVAHDLNNVLGVLVGYAELLMMSTPEGSTIGKHAARILEGGQRAAAIIQDLLTMARRGVAMMELLNLNDIVAEFMASLEMEKIRTLHPRVTFAIQTDPELMNMKGSRIHLTKTLMNLVLNAAESITGSGKVTIATENIYLDAFVPDALDIKEGEYILLTVSDTGGGIKKEDIGRIFEPFYTKKVMGRSGTGLGLAVVWGTVKDHGGYIKVESEEGRGTHFSLYFPLCREAISEKARGLDRQAYAGRGERILVVDDAEDQCLLAKSLLERIGYIVDTVSSGEEAVAYLRKHHVDLVVLDMIMDPGWDGLDTYKEILKVRPDQRAIIVSGFAQTERVSEAQRLGAGPYVKKPYILEHIGLAVRGELDRHWKV